MSGPSPGALPIGALLVTHGDLGRLLVACAADIVGALEAVDVVSVDRAEPPAAARVRIAEAIRRLDAGRGVLVLTDLFGGTPSNLALSLAAEATIEVVAGVNLPMLLKLATLREGGGTLADLASAVAVSGQKGVVHASALTPPPKA